MQPCPTKDVNSAIKQSTYVSISLTCYAFVLWQTVQCIEKYIEKPQGTKLSLQHTSQIHQFPEITICDGSGWSWSESYDTDHLKKCGLSGNDYYTHGKWVGNATLDENCTNPKALFESIVTKREDLISYIIYSYFDASEATYEYATTSPSKIIRSHVDTNDHGRCYTFSPTNKMIKSGIKEIILGGVWKKSRIYFHTNGMFAKKVHRHMTQILANEIPSEVIDLDLDFTVYDMLDFGGQPCEIEPRFHQDACMETKLNKKSIELFNCTTPFGTNKDRICQDYENGSKVMEMYRETIKKNVDSCYSPCSFLSTKATKTLEYPNPYEGVGGYVKIRLNENIKVIKAYHLYTTLSMIAEIGGYVGLFLGISVIQVSALVNVVLDRFYWIFNKNKRT